MTHRRGWMGLAALAVMAGVPLRAQSPWLPASDPVGIARSGAGVAYGRSLEAAALNPALLVTLPGKGGAYLAGGMASASGQSTLQSNSRTLYTDDRNRAVAALGAFWSLGESFALGLKLDTPFLRQGELPREGGLRFSGSALDLSAHRLEAQFAWAIRPDFSVGPGVGFARLSLDERVALRAVVPVDPALPVSATNTALGLVETELLQEGRK
ncbi:MAG TPA: outer membrane protein transport protein, partial [Holophaga sp.]|nr:outer membrane protein transport protein [Holophaga sp.]